MRGIARKRRVVDYSNDVEPKMQEDSLLLLVCEKNCKKLKQVLGKLLSEGKDLKGIVCLNSFVPREDLGLDLVTVVKKIDD